MLNAAEQDPRLRKQLLSQAQLASTPSQDWRKAISSLLGRKRFMDSRESIAYAKQLQPLNALLEQARQRDPLAALDLHEYAFNRLLTIYTECDDSSGHVGDRLRALARLHAEFVHSARPNNLAKRLLALYLRDEWSLMPLLRDYATLLDHGGIAVLEHEVLRTLHNNDTRNSAERLAAEALLEHTAHCSGNVQTMLDWFANHCKSGWDYLQMARRCTEHGRERQAIEWLERSIKADPNDPRLPTALAYAYAGDGFPEDALQQRWNAYVLQPMETTYLALREAALALGPCDRNAAQPVSRVPTQKPQHGAWQRRVRRQHAPQFVCIPHLQPAYACCIDGGSSARPLWNGDKEIRWRSMRIRPTAAIVAIGKVLPII